MIKKTKQSMDLFGKALKAYYLGDRSKFYFKDPSGALSEHDLKRYFRNTTQLSKLEKKLISLCYGNILDVGCGTGNYIPLLAKRGKVLGIDISPNVIEVAKDNGCKNCLVADVFTLIPKTKFDSITFLENNLGIGGSLDSTKNLFKKLSVILKKDGQILAISKNFRDNNYFSIELNPVWKNEIGPKFGWIHFNMSFLSELCKKEGFTLKILQGNQYCSLIRIQKAVRSTN